MDAAQQQAIAKYQKIDPRATLAAMGVNDGTIDLFVQHHKANPDIWLHFEQYAIKALAKGIKIGAKAIMERVRWETEVEGGKPWKCNNSYTAYYARMFAAKYPEAKKMFEFRTIKGLKT